MSDGSKEKYFTEMLLRLQKEPKAIAWPQRRVLAKAVCESIANVGTNETTLGLMFQLADDPKWEVRKDIADCLLLVPEEDFPRLTAKLSDDSNTFVSKATERALDRRRRGQKTVARRKRGLDQVGDLQSIIEKKYGMDAAKKSSQMAERLYDIMVGATVHDMKGILTPLKSSTEGLLTHLAEDDFDTKTFNKALSTMANRLAIMERLMDDMRVYSQATPIERRRERLLDVVTEAHSMVRELLQAKERDANKVTINICVPENITLEISRHQIVVTIANLIKNAYESFATGPDTFEAGTVEVHAKIAGDDKIELTVKDNGMGLNEEELVEVRRFVPGGTSKKQHGTGFGLPIARRKVLDHNGSLQIDSDEEIGTTVTITLPVNAEAFD